MKIFGSYSYVTSSTQPLLTNPFEWYENAPSLQLPGSGSTPDDAEEEVITTTTAQTEAPETVTLQTTAAEGHLSLACSNGLDNYADECQKLCGNSLDAQLDFCH